MVDLQTGEIFAGCRILAICGKGGFGTVYLATDALGKSIALKIVNAVDRERELHGIRRYLELSSASPWLLRIFHVGIERGELFYLMEAADPFPGLPQYLPDTLGTRLKTQGRMMPDEALTMIRKITDAVIVLHRSGLIHRDIKPDNIIFSGGEPKLSDPGLVCTQECSMSFAGTLGFLPPECFSGDIPNSKGSDLYALGKVFYCAVTGNSPGCFPRLPQDLNPAICRKLLPIMIRACNVTSRKRYADVAEFRKALPVCLPQPGWWERRSEQFRLWRLMHIWLWRGILAGLLIAVLLLFFGIERQQRRRHMQQRQLAKQIQLAGTIRQNFLQGGILLILQQHHDLGRSEILKYQQQIQASDPETPEGRQALLALPPQLEKTAEAEAERARKIPVFLKRSGAMRNLLDSPLGSWLSEARRNQLKAELAADEAAHQPTMEDSPRPGKIYHTDSSRIFTYCYVPPGKVIVPEGQAPIVIDYPMWVAETELTVQQFSVLAHFVPAGNREPGKPVVGILWNDIMDACRSAFRMAMIGTQLPEGYIIRPLTEKEWLYCLYCGMRDPNPDCGWNRSSGAQGVRAAGSAKPNAFGLYDMLGNAAEMVLADDLVRPDSYRLRGGSFRQDAKEIASWSSEVVHYQAFMDYAGVRLAVAPGNLEMLEKEYRSGTPGHWVHEGRHFEYFGTLLSCFSEEDAKALCTMMNGHPASMDSPELIRLFYRHSQPNGNYPTRVGAEFRNGKWFWHNGNPIQKELPPPEPGQQFMLYNRELLVKPGSGCVGFICEWSEEEWQNRQQWRKDPKRQARMVLQFRSGDHDYALCRITAYPHVHRRIAEILGGKLAEPETPEAQKEIAQKISRCTQDAVLLGGVWKHRFQWITSGNPIPGTLLPAGRLVDSAPSLSAPALKDGTLCAIQLPGFALMDFPVPPETAR